MNILDNCQLTDDEADLCCLIINNFGDGEHNPVDEASVYFYTPDYLLKSIATALENSDLKTVSTRLQDINALKTKIEAHEKRVDAEFAAFKASATLGKQVVA